MTVDGDARSMNQEALRLERAGHLAAAEAMYQRLLARWPHLADTWFNLAVLQRKAGRFDAALASYQQALAHGISQPEEVHLNRGVIYSDCLRRDEAAAAELRAALVLNPDYVPALLNLANLQEDLGRREDAQSLYERVLTLDARCHVALARYASLKTATGPDASITARLHQALAVPDVPSVDRASLGFALGTALEKGGDYDQAFATITEANRQSRLSAMPGNANYDRVAQERLVDALIATGNSAPSVSAPAAGIAAARVQPIFVCGMFRSGSTLVQQILAGHPQVEAGGELDFLPALVRTELAPFPASMARLTPQVSSALATRYLDRLSRLHPGARYVVDKRPDNFLYIGLIKALFPDARIIHTIRQPLDNCLSVFFLHLDHSMAYALDLMDIGHYYRQYLRLMTHWKSLYGDDILDVSYDELVREPRPVVARVLEFCGLDWDDHCLAFDERENAVKTASVWQVRQPLYQHASGRARYYAPQLELLAEYLRQSPEDALKT